MDYFRSLVIDVQNGMFPDDNPLYNGNQLLRNQEQLIAKARSKAFPIIYIQHNSPVGKPLEHGTDGWKIHSRIQPAVKDIIIEKKTPDSFYQTNLHEELKKKQIDHLIISGIQTEACVDTTCRRAFH